MAQEPENDSQHALPAHLTSEAVQPWERQTRESDREWAIFSCYRMSAYEQGDPAQGKYTARHMGRFAEQFGVGVGYIYQLASAWRWNERCAAYDQLVDRQRTHTTLTALERMRDRHEQMNAMRHELWVLAQTRLMDDFLAGRVHLKPSEIEALGKGVQDADRLLNGQATAVTETRNLTAVVTLQGASPEVIEWHRKAAEAKLAAGE